MKKISALKQELDSNGFVMLRGFFNPPAIEDLAGKTGRMDNRRAGTRRFLEHDWCRLYADVNLRSNEYLEDILAGLSAVQCTYFDKTTESNWLVPFHRDLFIPVKERFSNAGWRNWSVKEGVNFVTPPEKILEEAVAVRIHIDAAGAKNGALTVKPKTHLRNVVDSEPVICAANPGDVLLMKPLLVHGSSKSERGRRRVLHYLFGSTTLPDGAEWNWS